MVARLRRPSRPEPEVLTTKLRLAWVRDPGAETGRVTVENRVSDSASIGSIMPDGSLLRAHSASTAAILALRNLAADSERKLRRFGFDEQACPFCAVHLAHDTLAFNIGHCEECAMLLRWPFDQLTAERAEDGLRADILRELEEEDREE